MNLNEKQKEAFDKVLKGKNIFISGPGGVGKSFLVNKIVDTFPESTVVLAPTGIAALNIGGATIHSTFRLPLGIMTKSVQSKVNGAVVELFGENSPVKRVIIDEISMNRQDVFKTIDEHLKRARRSSKPFGGIQVIAVGDYFQLPPVVTKFEKKNYFDLYESEFSFGGDSWSSGGFEYIELDQIMRQSDETFISHLQKIRKKEPGFEKSVKFFNDIGTSNFTSVIDKDPVYLCTTNAIADSINEEHYNQLDGDEHEYLAMVSGEFKDRPSPFDLKLKYGAKVMFTANTDHFKNGTIGYVTGFHGDKIEILLEHNEQTILVSQHTWENIEYEVDGDKLRRITKGKYIQYPLKLAWACTVHKSQGLSLDSAVINPGRGFFASGQLYVALSRIRTLDGLALSSPINIKDVIVDDNILEFYKNDCRGIGL